MGAHVRSLRGWSPRRWTVTVLVSVTAMLVIAIPTDLPDTPLFNRDVPPEWWAWPALAVSAVLTGLLAATYVADPTNEPAAADTSTNLSSSDQPARQGSLAGLLTFFAVGCPVCNKLALLALGYSGALAWFRSFQPVLQLVAVGLLLWALRARLAAATACTVSASSEPRRVPTTHEEF
ncbi:MAG TPA: hypothetical protein VFL99_15925 [Segeticoccus sp.]|uniref:hypothetical protein n=1 Tax=Segeticoccus sp. TaxID=2706531 RepID=UPI002D7FDEFD|nr:hypothetical protein [Segeticoccus sp.]HET8601813.1 hypothetical protein [Segeticoccus sp.]